MANRSEEADIRELCAGLGIALDDVIDAIIIILLSMQRVPMLAGQAPKSAPTGSDTYSSAIADAHNYMTWLIDSFSPFIEAPILEVGVGHGSYAEVLSRFGEYSGVDIDARNVEMAREKFLGNRFHVADVTKPLRDQLPEPIEVRTVVCFNVLEHIDEHDKAVACLADALAPGGRLLILVPALMALMNDLDRLAGHVRRYSLPEVEGLLVRAGLEVEYCKYFNPIGGVGWWANRFVRHKSLNDGAVNGQIRLFDKWAIPVSRLVGPLTQSFFGQSLIAVGRKR